MHKVHRPDLVDSLRHRQDLRLATNQALSGFDEQVCIDPAFSAQAKLLKHKPQQAFASPGPGGAAGGCKSQSSHQ